MTSFFDILKDRLSEIAVEQSRAAVITDEGNEEENEDK